MDYDGLDVQEQKHIFCSSCHHRVVLARLPKSDGVFSTLCEHCGHVIRFRAKISPKTNVQFTINSKSYVVGSEFDVTLTLSEFIRNVARLPGTKVMCRQGGCGSCVVMATYIDTTKGHEVSKAINSCLCPVYSCDGWQITTTEGIGNQQEGYHIIQETIAEKNGSQCGFCTPGMVMSTYSLLNNKPHPSAEEVEDILDGNLCRCTGYRAILDAVHSVVKSDAPDIEDISMKKDCFGKCEGSFGMCINHQMSPLVLYLQGAQWYRPTTLQELYGLLTEKKNRKLKLVVGNTSLGLTGDDSGYKMFVDTKLIKDLYLVQLTNPAMFGANITLSDLICHLEVLKTKPGYQYCAALSRHLKKIASTPVRNVASWAGNLAVKHAWPTFPSDVFTLFETVGAKITLGNQDGTEVCSPLDFLHHDIQQKVILKVTFLPLDQSVVSTYKVMPRSQNALAYVNAGFEIKIDSSYRVKRAPAIVFGGVSSTLTHAYQTENYLQNKVLSDPVTLKGALQSLQHDLDACENTDVAPYKKKLASSLFYKFLLKICVDKVSLRLRSGGLELERPVSSGVEDYDTDKTKWPLTEPLPKISAKKQAAGEAMYIPDMCALPGQLYGAFVLSSVGNATIKDIDPSAALSTPGVVRFITAKDIPGQNNYMPEPLAAEQVFSSGPVLYAGQAMGLILADSQRLADLAAEKVKVTYTDIKRPITDIREAIAQKSFYPSPGGNLTVGKPDDAMKQAACVITGEVAMGTQYHFTMETQSCACIPREDGLDVYPTTQWLDASQSSVAQVCGLKDHQVCVSVKRVGGAYGSKITRNFQVSAACAVASQTTNKPVQVHMNLQSNMKMVGKRFPYLAKYKVGVDSNNKLVAVEVTYYCDCGSSINDQTVSSIKYFSDNAYYCPNWKINTVAVKTNAPSHTSCRAPGSTPAIFIMESIMEQVAMKLGHDPTYIKLWNLYQKGQMTPVGQELSYCQLHKLCYQLMEQSKYAQRLDDIQVYNKANRWKKRGLSLVPMKYGVVFIGNTYSVQISVYNNDGSIVISHGGVEVGQGINTKAVQVCAYELGIDMTQVCVRPCDSVTAANSSSTGGSITSELICLGVINCCEQLKQALAPIKKKMKAPSWLELVQKAYMSGVDLTARYWVAPQPPPAEVYQTYGVTVAEVEVDILTGENQLTRVDMLYDVGQSMNPEVDMGQAQGAFVMGLGYFLLEETRYDPDTGQNLSADTWTYHPPTSKDIPVDFRIKFLHNSPNPKGVLGAKVVGEPPLCMSCCALFAVQHAIQSARDDAGHAGAWSLDAPATVEKIQLSCLTDVSQFVF